MKTATTIFAALLLIIRGFDVSSVAAENLAKGSGGIDFHKDIRPILESHCIECHGPKKQKSGLRLDKKSSAFQGGDSGKPAIVSGKSAESVIIQKITSKDPDEVMPPKGERLTAEQTALVKKWIDQGAVWEEREANTKHWAYIAPVRPQMPKVKDKNWCRNGIDFFVLNKLEQEKLRPSPEVERSILIRRVSLDIIGLPPTPQEVEDFIADKSPLAYERLADRLLASPHYGERWARSWLDLARYADTQGYEKDDRRSIWPYRDWVISALNCNMPFDQFTIEQLAGDLLPSATRDQKVATGFHRNTMTNTEGGTDDEEFRHEAIVDRVNTTMSVWMGTTFGCAQCHNHKYDPITTKEYYQFYAFLNNTADSDKPDEAPTMKLPTSKQEQRLEQLRNRIKALDEKFNEQTLELTQAQDEWGKKSTRALTNWQVLDPASYESTGGATLVKTNDSILVTGRNPSNDVYRVLAPLAAGKFFSLRLDVLPDPNLPEKPLGRHPNGTFVLSRLEAAIASANQRGEFTSVNFKSARADYSQEGYSATNLIAQNTNSGWAVSAADPKYRVKHSVYLTLTNSIDVAEGSLLKVTLRHDSKWPDANVGRFRLAISGEANADAVLSLPEGISKLLRKTVDKRDEKEKKELTGYYRSIAPELKPVRDELAKLREEETAVDKAIAKTSIMVELDKPRQTHRLIRGGFLSKGEAVSPGTPAAFHPFPINQPANRLTLAQWLVDTKNPLTARVTINRIWEHYFGIGIVETTQDFGTQGDLPANAQLLDWLATEFLRQKWDMKAMHKLIVMSSTYRQSSKARPELLQRDPYNRLLARGPRIRLEAEQIRDQALAVSGLLSPRMGGPSVMPHQPDGLWQVVYSGDKWETSKGEDRYRRGVYTFWRRSMPHPAMTTFDAPTREYCVLKRDRSDTPLQALVLLNDPEYVESAQALARRVLREIKSNDTERAAYAFRLCVGRSPTRAEVDRILALAANERQNFAKNSKAAVSFANFDAKREQSIDAVELAAWTVVGNVLLNLDETVTKN